MNPGFPPQGPYGNAGGPRPPQRLPQRYRDPQQQWPPQQQRPPQQQGWPPQRPQQQPTHPQFGAGAPVGQQLSGSAWLQINTKYFPLAWFFAFCKPTIVIDGREVNGVWGSNNVPLAPGRHHVHVHVPYFFPPTCGPADVTVDVAPGQATALEYKAPVWSFGAGSLGHGEQTYNGMGALIAVLAVPIVLVLLVFVVMMVALVV